MAERKLTTRASESEELNVALTANNYPFCLRGHDVADMADGCVSLVTFIRHAVPAMMDEFRDSGVPEGERFHRLVAGFGLVCSLLVDRLEIAAGRGCSPMPLLKDLEARHG
ncbi:MAG: hypothetical protein K6E40_13800 [Desulfovibrio sp.]|nr:hypothetical protein [Desulfovibrio sp.]